MHQNQRNLLDLAQLIGLTGKSLREISTLAQISHPYTTKFHLQKLVDQGFLDAEWRLRIDGPNFVRIPIYGTANCGVATHLAENKIEGYLPVSRSLLQGQNLDNLFALKASGDSMNKATPAINDGDYVLVLKGRTNIDENRDVLVTVFDNVANIKRIQRKDDMVLFLSQSTKSYPPIIASLEDFESGAIQIVGKVVKVIPSK